MPTGFLARLLSTASHANLPPEDARTAIATVLVMAARADDQYDAGEREVIDRILSERYNLSPDDAAALRMEGEAVEAEAIDVFQFTRAIKQVIPLEERTAILEALWTVVLADNVRDPHEDALMRVLAERLGLSPMESAQARQRVSG
jgi:uncharacterized tellurite resistance protein B-like protein